jgi:hypothetical protein
VVTGRTCDSLGNEFEFDAHNHTNLLPAFSSSALFLGPLQRVKYYDEPKMKRIYPRSIPLQTKATLLVEFLGSSLYPWTLAELVSSKTRCRLETCDLQQCPNLDACACRERLPTCLDVALNVKPGCTATCAEEAMCTVEYHSDDSVLVHLTEDAGGSGRSNLRAVAISFNGQDWLNSSEVIAFYHLPVSVSHQQTQAGFTQIYSFGVVTDNNAMNEYFRLTDIAGGTPLIAYFQEPYCDAIAPSAANVDCLWRIPRGGAVFEVLPPGQPQLVFRFSPGTCSEADARAYAARGAGYKTPRAADKQPPQADGAGRPYIFPAPIIEQQQGCCEQGSVNLDMPMAFSQVAGGWFAQVLGTAPPGAPAGAYHLCYSIDGIHFAPLVYNHFTTFASKASVSSYVSTSGAAANFLFYNISITGQTIIQGPSMGSEYRVSILGRGFPLAADLIEYAPSIRVYFSNSVQIETLEESLGNDRSIVNIESAERISVRLPTVMLAANESTRQVKLQLTFDNQQLLPKAGLSFTFYPPPTIEIWFPLYGLFETETVVTITGTKFVDTGEARCRFPGATCDSEIGGTITPCIRRATYISPTKYTCVVPSRRSKEQGKPSSTDQKMQFSPFAPESLWLNNPDLYEQQFLTYTSPLSFNYHLKFQHLFLSSFSAPVNAPELQTDKRSLLLDATLQMLRIAGDMPVCMNFQRMFREGAFQLGMRNDGALVETNMISLKVDSILDTIQGCPLLDGFCVGQIGRRVDGVTQPSQSCVPTSGDPDGRKLNADDEFGCCKGQGMDPITCCPKLDDARWQQDPQKGVVFNDKELLTAAGLEASYLPETATLVYTAKCKTPNTKKYPEKIKEASVEICPVTIKWRLPTIRICRGGPRSNQFCGQGGVDCGTGLCMFMPMNAIVQVSTNGGQLFSGPSTTTVLFYQPPQLTSIFPQRVVKDCGESLPGKMDCGWGASWQASLLPASMTLCGKESFCSKRQKIVFTLGSGLVSGPCTACLKIFINRKAFSKVKCKFEIGVPGTSVYKFVLADALYTSGNLGSTVSCDSPVLNDPALVTVSMALDGDTFVNTIRDPLLASFGATTSVVFIRSPEVTAVLPTNGIFDANTEINITGNYFCNNAAAMPCANLPGQYHNWCIFDFMGVKPRQDSWSVERKYTPALVIDDKRMVCRAPAIAPDAVPARPRCMVGVILHGIFDKASGVLVNSAAGMHTHTHTHTHVHTYTLTLSLTHTQV